MRPDHSAAATTASMYSVRWAGMPKPASSTYNSAAAAPASAATFCAGSSSGSCAPVKTSGATARTRTAANSPAIIVMCRPEIEIRWLMPVRLKIVPVGLVDRALVADHQRHDHAGVLLARQRAQDAFAQPGAAKLDQVGRC